MRKIYQIPVSMLSEEMIDPFYFSELNERQELPKEVKQLMQFCKEADLVYTIDNFMTCFNLQDQELQVGEYYMFCPDEKFNVN